MGDLSFDCCCCCCGLMSSSYVSSSEYSDSFSEERPDFSSPLCSCEGDGCEVMFSFCCPCLAIPLAMSLHSGANCCFMALCAPPPASRNILREGYGIDGDCTSDICVGCFCMPCTARQMLYETRERGVVKPLLTRSALKKAKSSRSNVRGRAKGGSFSNDLVDCNHVGLGDVCRSIFCGPCFSAQTRSTYNGSDWCFNFLCMTSCVVRNSLREQQRIKGNCAEDICAGVFCYPCSILQVAHEVDNIVKARTKSGMGAEKGSTAKGRIAKAWNKGPGAGSGKKKGSSSKKGGSSKNGGSSKKRGSSKKGSGKKGGSKKGSSKKGGRGKSRGKSGRR